MPVCDRCKKVVAQVKQLKPGVFVCEDCYLPYLPSSVFHLILSFTPPFCPYCNSPCVLFTYHDGCVRHFKHTCAPEQAFGFRIYQSQVFPCFVRKLIVPCD